MSEGFFRTIFSLFLSLSLFRSKYYFQRFINYHRKFYQITSIFFLLKQAILLYDEPLKYLLQIDTIINILLYVMRIFFLHIVHDKIKFICQKIKFLFYRICNGIPFDEIPVKLYINICIKQRNWLNNGRLTFFFFLFPLSSKISQLIKI